MAPQRQLEAIPSEELGSLYTKWEFLKGIQLLGQDLVFRTPTGETKRAHVLEVEPFTGMKLDSHNTAFNSKTRQAGEFFVIWHRGMIPFLNVVVDATAKSIVCIKKVILDGKEVSPLKIINEMGLGRDKAAHPTAKTWRTNVVEPVIDTADSTSTSSQLHLESPEEVDELVLRRVLAGTKARAENSLGVFVNAKHINNKALAAASTSEEA